MAVFGTQRHGLHADGFERGVDRGLDLARRLERLASDALEHVDCIADKRCAAGQ